MTSGFVGWDDDLRGLTVGRTDPKRPEHSRPDRSVVPQVNKRVAEILRCTWKFRNTKIIILSWRAFFCKRLNNLFDCHAYFLPLRYLCEQIRGQNGENYWLALPDPIRNWNSLFVTYYSCPLWALPPNSQSVNVCITELNLIGTC